MNPILSAYTSFLRPSWQPLGVLALVAGLLSGRPLAGQAQAPAAGPAIVVGTAVGQGQSTVASTAIDAQGYVYVAGSYQGTVQLGSTTLTTSYPTSTISQGFVAKLDGAGSYQWVRPVSGASSCYGGGLVVDATGTLTVTGSFFGESATLGPFTLAGASTPSVNGNSDGFVGRLDTNGNWLWATAAGGPGSDAVGRPVLDGAGNVYVSGGFSGPTVQVGATTLYNTGPGNYDAFVAKLDAAGTWQWARSGGGPNQDGINQLALDGSGNIYFAGFVQGAATYGPFATASPTSAGNADVLAGKLDPAGNWLWLARGGGEGIDESAGLAVDAAGNAYLSGRFTGPTATLGPYTLTNANGSSNSIADVLVAKLDATGRWQWAVRAGGTEGDAGGPLAFDAAGRLVLAGSFGSSPAQFGSFSLANTASGQYGSATLFLAYLDPATGSWLGVASGQGGVYTSPSCLATDAAGNFSLSGSFQGSSVGLGAATLVGQAGAPTGFVTLVPMVPVLAAFAPGSGAPGQVVTITGTGFAGVTDVLFNEKPAAAFTVQSATRLVATVPAGVMPGPISVRTKRGTSGSGVPFQPLALAATPAVPGTEATQWPNPAATGEPWQVRLPAGSPSGATRAEVRNVLGQLVFATQFSGPAGCLPVPCLAPGVYQLMLAPMGQAARQHRVVVAE